MCEQETNASNDREKNFCLWRNEKNGSRGSHDSCVLKDLLEMFFGFISIEKFITNFNE